MISFVKRLWRAAPLATVIFVLALAVSMFFGARMVSFYIYWQDPAHREQVVADWMTPGYIGHSWQVPREVIINAMKAPEPPPRGVKSLADIAAYRGVTKEALIVATQKAIDEFRAKQAPLEKQTP